MIPSRRWVLATLVVFAAAAPTVAQVVPSAWAGDARELLAAMDSVHPAPYRVHPREEWIRAGSEFEARAPSLHYHEFAAGLARLLALAGDGHTRLGLVRLADHQRAQIAPGPGEGFDTRYPVSFEVFADGLYVVQTDPDHVSLLGRKVAAINGIPTEEAFSRFQPYISADNVAWQWHLFPQYLASPGLVAGVGLTSTPSEPLHLTLSGTESPTEAALSPVESVTEWVEADRRLNPAIVRPAYRTVESPYALQYLPATRTVYVRIRQIQNRPEEPLAAFADRLFRLVDSVAADRLVLDLRGNGGGNNYLNQPLVHGLIRSTRINRPGGLFVITDRGTFSAAVSLLADIEQNTYALVVGEPAGAAPNSPGDSRRIRLPASGLEVRISALFWQQSDPRDQRQWVAPDLPAPLRFADWVAGRDPAMDAILSYQADTAAAARRPNTNWTRPSQRASLPPFVVW